MSEACGKSLEQTLEIQLVKRYVAGSYSNLALVAYFFKWHTYVFECALVAYCFHLENHCSNEPIKVFAVSPRPGSWCCGFPYAILTLSNLLLTFH